MSKKATAAIAAQAQSLTVRQVLEKLANAIRQSHCEVDMNTLAAVELAEAKLSAPRPPRASTRHEKAMALVLAADAIERAILRVPHAPRRGAVASTASRHHPTTGNHKIAGSMRREHGHYLKTAIACLVGQAVQSLCEVKKSQEGAGE